MTRLPDLSRFELQCLRLLWARKEGTVRDIHRELDDPPSYSTVRKIVSRAGEHSRLPFPVHPHMLRHATGYKLANDGHDTRAIQHYLGHKNIRHTVRYTQLSSVRFRDFWQD